MPDGRTLPGQPEKPGCPGFVLTQRQRQVLALAAIGLTDLAIARRLNRAPRTVQDHLRAARSRLGALNTTHAVALAIVLGLISIDTFLSEKGFIK